MQIGEMSWKDFQEEEPEIALLPAGSTEQHGPHGPLKTDTLIAEEMAKRAAEKSRTLVLPTLNVGVSREHSKFPGTLYISPETFRKLLTEIVLSAHENGVDKFVVVNGHGGNVSHIREVCENLYHDHEILALEWTWFNAISAKEMGHGGKLETSLIKYLHSELLGKPVEPGSKTWGQNFHGARIDYDTKNFTKTGVIGDPTEATRKKGKKLFNAATEKLLELIEDLKRGEPELSL